jgi:hypothetical protein
VNDEKDTPGSGSRWEPGAVPGSATSAAGTPAAAEAPTAEVPYQAPAAELPAHGIPAGVGVPPESRRGLRGRVALLGVGAALTVAGGVGGFALGHAAAGTDGDESSVVQRDVPGHKDGAGLPTRPDFGDRGTRPDVDGAVPGDPHGDGSGSDDSAGDGTT